ncbi:MAG: Ig-like domain-containing protein, partial [Desulfuromonadales bacterium]|nr:Ig-like domain-containing protein [Desulfuromonadales bacterium]
GTEKVANTATITISGANDGPVAVDVAATASEDGPVVTISADYSDIDVSDTHSFSVDTTGTVGLVTNNGDGTFDYDPNGQFESLSVGDEATDTFQYTVTDVNGLSDTKTVTVTITGDNDAPTVAAIVSGPVSEDAASYVIDLLSDASASDVDLNDTLSVTDYSESIDVGTIPVGALSLDADGKTLTIDPDAFGFLAFGETRVVTVSYNVFDGTEKVANTATITISGANDTPSDISLIGRSVDENDPGAIIGFVSVTDLDANDSHVYTLSDDRFEIVGNQLKLVDGASLDYDMASRIDLVITATDSQLASYSETFTINVIDVDDSVPTVVVFTLTDQSGDGIVAIDEPALVRIVFSEPVRPFDAATAFDLTNAAGTLGPFSSMDGGVTWTASFIPAADTDQTDRTITLKEGSVSDQHGNSNVGDSVSTSYAVDTVAPMPEISLAAVETANDDSIVNIAEAAGNVTITGTVTGEFNEGDTVTLTLRGAYSQAMFTGIVAADGTFSVDVAGSALVDDLDRKIEASITTDDAAGNRNTVDRVLPTDADYDVDVTAPVPTITLDANITDDDIINSVEAAGDVQVTGSVGGEFDSTNALVTLTVNNSSYTGTVDASGLFSIAVSGADLAADAERLVRASVTTYDDAENPGTASDFEGYSVDLLAPPSPILLSLSEDTGDSATDRYTSDRTPTLSGIAEQGSRITVYRDGEAVDDTIVTDSQGYWTYTPTADLDNGDYLFTATATDAAGNVSTTSAGFAVTIDGTAPDKPTIVRALDNVEPYIGEVLANGESNDRTPTLEGSAEALSTVKIYNGETLLGTVQADGEGSWQFTTAELAEDVSHSFTVKAIDKAGNESVSSDAFVLHIVTDVAPPVITHYFDDVGEKTGDFGSGSYTDDLRPELAGTAKPGTTIRIYEGTLPDPVASTMADGNGDWQWTPATDLSNNTSYSYTATAEDGAGNVSVKSEPFVLHIKDSVAAPAITSVVDDYGPGTGPLMNGAHTDDATPTISGLAEANSTVKIFNGTTQIGATQASGSGVWSFAPSSDLEDAPYVLTATATDLAGNVSASSSAFHLTIDT